ncbi:SURF1 family protein [Actibacterium lipolyticum]|uniref:SURF1-like protein n=1 Tax=Actibacterium lipolyticum TaxID=1524263 RepID=A0A238KMJ7_9RHOB|nr:SURF1 family protein [Actibacterium lipolyticum]SMX43928.1 SURF1 family protein [Actibacterium lipolyticum]
MTRRMILPFLFGIFGMAILIGLGVWQLQRLEWKEAVLADIDSRIGSAPVAIPAMPDPDADRYLPVEAVGTFIGEELRVLASVKLVGAGHRLVSAFETDGRRVLVDRGFLPLQTDAGTRPDGAVTVVGNIHWPDEIDGFTPAPDLENNLWFARDVAAMANALGTEPVLIIARDITPRSAAITPMPVNSAGIPNDHLSYAITWFSLAFVWLGMTALLLWRIRRKTD